MTAAPEDRHPAAGPWQPGDRPGYPPQAQTGPFRWGCLREAPRSVWLLTAAFLLLLTLATALWPPYRGPDEPQHVDLAAALDQGVSPLWLPATREISVGAWTGGVLPNSRIGEPQRLADREVLPRGERPSYEDFGGAASTGFTNQLVQHPPGYYVVLSGVLRLLPDWRNMPLELVVGVLRLVGVVLVAPLPLLAWATARRLSPSPTVPLLAAVGVLGVPQLVHISAGVNNDALQNLTAAVCTLLVVHVTTGDTTRRTALWAGLVLGLGLLSKGLVLVFVGVLLAGYLLAWWRAPGERWRVVGSALLATAVAGVVGGWWWVRNVVLTGRVQPAGDDRSTEAVRGWEAAAEVWAEDLVRFVLIRFWFDHPSGSDTGLSVTLSYWATGVVGVLVLLALLLRRPPGTSRAVALVLVLPLCVLAVLLVVGSYESFRLGQDQPAFQGRYLFPGLVGVAAVTALGWHRLLRRRTASAVLLMLLWALASQALGAASAVRLYWWPADGRLSTLLSGMMRVLPWPTPTVPLLLVLLVGATSAAAAALLRDAWTLGRGGAASADGPRDDDVPARSGPVGATAVDVLP